MAKKFKDRIFGSNVDKKIIDIFNNLQKGSFQTEPLESTQPTHQDYIGDRTTFARMWTALLVKTNESEEIKYHVVNDNREKSYQENEPIGNPQVFSELTENPYLKPKAGITSISVKTEGALGTIKNTTIEFVVHNKKDFETIFLPFFLKPGSTVVVDYGWSDKNVDLYSVTDAISNSDLQLTQFKKFIYGEKNKDDEILTNGFINDNLGVADTIIGRVANYKANVNSQGSFECSLELRSENTSLLDAEITEENKLKYLFTNQIEDIIIELLTSGQLEQSTKSKYTVLDAKSKKEALNDFYDSINLSSDGDFSEKKALIPKQSLKAGLFYQNITDVKNILNVDREVLYINYGLFEDLFLNSLIAQSTSANKHDINFNTKETFVRYDNGLIQRQRAVLGSEEQLPLFLYPSSWQDTYNGKTPIEEYRTHRRLLIDGNQYENQFKTPIVPFRELFISVPLISKAFSKKQNVNDALEFIIEEINGDSYSVFKLKMISLNDSYSSVSLQDANLIPLPPEFQEDEVNVGGEEILTFDVTSGNSIVSNLDYNFELPKGGLSSIIAIGDKGDYEFLDDDAKDNLNFLRLLSETDINENNEVFYESLPIKLKKTEGELFEENRIVEYEFTPSSTKKIISKITTGMKNTSTEYKNAVDSVRMRKTQIETKKPKGFWERRSLVGTGLGKTFGLTKNPPPDSGGFKQPKSITSNTLRDFYGKTAKLNTVLSNNDTSVPPIMPININLTMYGNTYLKIGDIFLVNFLPKLHLKNVFFQILGIDHKVGSTWETTYTTKMRVRPTKKDKVIKTGLQKPVMDEKYTSEVTNKDNNVGMNTITQKGSLPIEDNILDGYVVHKITHVIDAVIKETSRDPNFTATDPGGDPRAVNTFFGFPNSRADIAMMSAFQQTVGFYLKESYNEKLQTFYNLSKDVEKYYLNADAFFTTEKVNQVAMRAFIEDKDGLFFGKQNAIIEFFNKIPVYEFNIPGVIEDLFGKNEFIKKNIYNDIKSTFPNKKSGQIESINSEDIDKLDDKYGVVIPSYVFKVGDYDDSIEEVFSYTIEVHNPGLTTNFMSILRIPDWFVQGNISGFIEKLEKNYSAAFLKLGGYTWLNPDGSFIEEQAEVTNPGYPFTQANYNTAPFGSSANAFEARQKLAQKFGFDGYFAYKGTKSIDDRKADWDNSSDIW